MAFTEVQEKNIILKWIYSRYKELNEMTVGEIYAYLLDSSKESFLADIDSMLTELDVTASKEEEDLIEYQDNIKDLQKKLKKL